MKNFAWEQWLYGLVAAFVGGGSSAVASGITVSAFDPKDWNVMEGKFYALVGALFMVNGTISFFAYLKTQPLPPMEEQKKVA
jgi:hypothetical protein